MGALKDVFEFAPKEKLVTVKSDNNNSAPGKDLIFQAFVSLPVPNHALMEIIFDTYEEYYRATETHFCSTTGLDQYWLGPCIWKLALQKCEGDDVFLLRESHICG